MYMCIRHNVIAIIISAQSYYSHCLAGESASGGPPFANLIKVITN